MAFTIDHLLISIKMSNGHFVNRMFAIVMFRVVLSGLLNFLWNLHSIWSYFPTVLGLYKSFIWGFEPMNYHLSMPMPAPIRVVPCLHVIIDKQTALLLLNHIMVWYLQFTSACSCAALGGIQVTRCSTSRQSLKAT